MHTMVRLALLVGITIAASSAVRSDDSAMSVVSGGTVQPMGNHASLRMEREAVDVKLGARVGNEWPVFVRCQFQFQNDGPATDVNMGFPENADAEGEATATGRLRGFKSWVDGQPAEIRHLASSTNPKDEFAPSYKAWYVKRVHFDSGQARRVVVVYSARLGFSNSSAGPKGMVFRFRYTLRTGANWKGSIGKVVINVDASAAAKHYRIDASPPGYEAGRNKLAWTFRDFEPKQDIEVTFLQQFPLLNGKPLPNANQWEPCFERNGVVMTNPLFLTELGADVDDSGEGCVVRYGRRLLKLRGSRAAVIDGKKKTLAHAIWQRNDLGELAVPLDEVVRMLGGSVEYDSDGRPNVLLSVQRVGTRP